MIITVPKKIRDKCFVFAKSCAKTNYGEYKRRKQTNIKKIVEDIYYGKLSEFAVYLYFRQQKCKLDPPDLQIYPPNEKRHGPDLVVNNYNIHIKSHKLNGYKSWVYQYNCHYKYTGIHIYCVTIDKTEVDVKYMISGNKLKNIQAYSPPLNQRLEGIKECVDELDIVEHARKL